MSNYMFERAIPKGSLTVRLSACVTLVSQALTVQGIEILLTQYDRAMFLVS